MKPAKTPAWILSKTSYIKGKQCIKALYLHAKQTVKSKSTADQWKYENKGRSFEDMVRKSQFPNGINLSSKLGNDYKLYPEHTSEILDSNKECVIFEAGILHHNAFILIDVLQKNLDGSIDLFEIKNKKKVNNYMLRDASFQYHIGSIAFENKLKSMNLILPQGSGSFKVINITEQSIKKQAQVISDIAFFTQTIDNESEPTISMDKHCSNPYLCKYISYCKSQLT